MAPHEDDVIKSVNRIKPRIAATQGKRRPRVNINGFRQLATLYHIRVRINCKNSLALLLNITL